MCTWYLHEFLKMYIYYLLRDPINLIIKNYEPQNYQTWQLDEYLSQSSLKDLGVMSDKIILCSMGYRAQLIELNKALKDSVHTRRLGTLVRMFEN